MTAIGKHVQRRMSGVLPAGTTSTSSRLTSDEFRASVEATLRGQGLIGPDLAARMARYDQAVGRVTQ